jgi:hypothetical protein
LCYAYVSVVQRIIGGLFIAALFELAWWFA